MRKDEECTDTVGVFLKVNAGRRAHFRISLGPQVQTLTKAMTAILCEGLDGAAPEEIMEVAQDFVPRIVGGQLVRVRSQTVYYILTRMKSVCKVWLNRERAERVISESGYRKPDNQALSAAGTPASRRAILAAFRE